MKTSRTLATGAAAALVGFSILTVGGSAFAADFYVDAADVGFVADGDPYLDSWFSGDVVGAEGTQVTTASGLAITVAPTGYQLLNGLVPTTTGLETLIAGAGFAMSAGTATFQVPMYFLDDADADTNQEFTTLRPAAANTLAGDWVSSSVIMAADGVTPAYASNTPYPLADLLTAMPSYEILAFGIFATSDATLVSITWDGNTHWFLPAAATTTITPGSLTVNAVESTGVTAHFTGFVPGETVTIGLGNGSSGNVIATVTADTNGVVDFTYIAAAGDVTVGTYTLSARAANSNVSTLGTFAVTANPVVLAATGADVTPAVLAGGLLLLLGGGFVVAARVRAASHRK